MKLRLFGGVHLSLECGQTLPIPSHRARALCAFLAIRPGTMVHRETICAELWPESSEAQARAQLRKAIWRIRSAFDRQAAPAPLRVEDHQIGLYPEGLWSDCWHFSQTLSDLALTPDAALRQSDAQSLMDAAALHTGAFAAGIYDNWCRDAQDSFARARLCAMERLFAYHQRQQRWIQAIDWAQRILEIDNLREHLHRGIMACHMSMGDRPSALRQFHICTEVLQDELGVGPMAETQALRDAIVNGEGHLPKKTAPRAAHGLQKITSGGLVDLDRAIDALGTVQRSLANVRTSIGFETRA